MEYERTTAHRDVERSFDSWSEFVTCAADNSRYAWINGIRSSHKDGEKWNGGESFEGCVERAIKTGWAKGRRLLADALVIASPRPEPIRAVNYDVAGSYPMVPLAIAGDPCAMVDIGDMAIAARPVLRIDYNHWINAYVTPKQIVNRGAAVLSACDTLERRGYSVELRIIANTGAGKYAFRYNVVYKKAGEPLDIDRAAFALVHPGALRRLGFAILEQHAKLEKSFMHSYGAPMRERNDNDPRVIYIPGANGPDQDINYSRQAVAEAIRASMPDYQEDDREAA